MLRNPGAAPKTLELDVGEAFELPADAVSRFAASSPWRADRGRAPVQLRAGTPHAFDLAPFEVLTLEAAPVAG